MNLHPSKFTFRPRAGREGTQELYRCSCTLSLTSELDGGGWSTPLPVRFSLGNEAVRIVQEAGWTTEPIWMGAENLAPPYRDSILGPSSPQRVAIPTELSRPTLQIHCSKLSKNPRSSTGVSRVIIDFNLLIMFPSFSGDKQNHVRRSKSTNISGLKFTQTSR